MSRERTFFRTVMTLIAAGGMTAAVSGHLQPDNPRRSSLAASPRVSRVFFDQYCVTCHNQKLKTAGLTLDTVDVDPISTNAEVLEKVARKLRSGQMPPPGRPRPDKAVIDAFVTSLEAALDETAAAAPNPGPPAIRRLNRVEYANVIRDLLALEIDGRALLPTDDSGYGFDNNADMLSVTPSTLERYMSAAAKISRLAVGDAMTTRPIIQVYPVSRFLKQNVRMSEDLSFGTRGGAAVRHTFPLDGEYQLKIRLRRDAVQSYIGGIDKPHQIEASLDGYLLKQWSIGGEVTGGEYIAGVPIDTNDPAQVRRHTYRQKADERLQLRFVTKAGTRVLGVAFIAAPGIPDSVSAGARGSQLESDATVDAIEISGPYNGITPEDTPSRRQLFVCRPVTPRDEAPCGRRILSRLARRAYRRPVIADDMRPLLRFYEDGLRKGGFERGIEKALERILVAPEFLFRIERGSAGAEPGTTFRVSDVELASRLSFFLWSSIPDEELLQVVARGALRNPTVLTEQVRRMLADPRATALVNNFAGQWLLVRNVRLSTPDPNLFPDFDENLKDALAREMELFFESQLREDRSVLDLLRANYTFVNERLATHYGIPNIRGSHFRRVTLTDEARFGLLGKGAVLLVTSYAHRTSPVVRGKWILENLLGAPPPPPPPDVPSLEESETKGKPTTVRGLMEEHRKNPLCASCHARMDPLGFTLENFDAVGRWRETDRGNPIDASGVLLDGTKVDGPVAFRNALLTHREEFVTTLTEKLLTFALGRGAAYYDNPAIRRIVRTEPRKYRWSDIIVGIVQSTPFQMNRIPPRAAPPPASTPTVAQSR